MFILCPHCQFLVAIDPASGLPPAQCPRCGKALVQPAAPSEPPAERATVAAPEPMSGVTDVPDSDAPREPAIAPVPATAAGAMAGRSDVPVAAPNPRSDAAQTQAPPARRADSAANTTRKRAAQSPRDVAVAPLAPATVATTAAREAKELDAAAPDIPPPARPARRRPSAGKAPERLQPAPVATSATPLSTEGPDTQTDAGAAHAAAPATDAALPGTPQADAAATTDEAAGDTVATAPTSSADAAIASPPSAAPQATTSAATSAPTRRTAPSFARAAGTARQRPRWRAVGAIAALALLLVLQVLLADRAALAADARFRPLVASLCGVLHCTLPAWHEPAAFTLLARDVRPARPGVLHVDASFRNDARWPQAWPLLHLALQDVEGRTVGARTLSPAEYLGGAPITQNGIATGQVANVAFDIAEPSATVVAFTFDFR